MLKLFSGKKQKSQEMISILLSEILEKGSFSLSFQLEKDKKENFFRLDIFGEDEGLLKSQKGKLLLAFQTYISRVLQKEFPEEKTQIVVDSSGFWQEQEERLLSLADRLIQTVLKTKRPVIFKQSLSPAQRRLIHEKVSSQKGVKSQSFGAGYYKKLKLMPEEREGQ